MSKHTQGPWEANGQKITAKGEENVSTGGKFNIVDLVIASTHYRDRRTQIGAGQAEANAKLIAAAPELLSALENLTKAMREDMPHFKEKQWPEYAKAMQAITKAIGK